MTEGQCAAARPLDARRETIMVQIEGELDHCSAGRVRATLDALIADPHVKRLVVDLTKLTFMDSSGIGVMIGRYRQLARRGDALADAGIAAEVVVVEPMGAQTELLVKVQDQVLTIMTTGRSSAGPGERVFLRPRALHAHLFDSATGERL